MKKALTITMTLALMLTAFAGCSKPTETQPANAPAVESTAENPDPAAENAQETTGAPEETEAEETEWEAFTNEENKVGVLSVLNMPEENYSKYRMTLAKASTYLAKQGLLKIIDMDSVNDIMTAGVPVPVYYDICMT